MGSVVIPTTRSPVFYTRKGSALPREQESRLTSGTRDSQTRRSPSRENATSRSEKSATKCHSVNAIANGAVSPFDVTFNNDGEANTDGLVSGAMDAGIGEW